MFWYHNVHTILKRFVSGLFERASN